MTSIAEKQSKKITKRGGPRMGAGGPRAGAGRPAGSLSPEKRALKELAQAHTESALGALVNIMQDSSQPASARVHAASVVLDRGHGRPIQNLEVEIDSRGFTPSEKAELERSYEEAMKAGVWTKQKAAMQARKKELDSAK